MSRFEAYVYQKLAPYVRPGGPIADVRTRPDGRNERLTRDGAWDDERIMRATDT
jgi:hypothetical protein